VNKDPAIRLLGVPSPLACFKFDGTHGKWRFEHNIGALAVDDPW
jgi:hypothetical protein